MIGKGTSEQGEHRWFTQSSNILSGLNRHIFFLKKWLILHWVINKQTNNKHGLLYIIF